MLDVSLCAESSEDDAHRMHTDDGEKSSKKEFSLDHKTQVTEFCHKNNL